MNIKMWIFIAILLAAIVVGYLISNSMKKKAEEVKKKELPNLFTNPAKYAGLVKDLKDPKGNQQATSVESLAKPPISR
jgi:lipopolysaccharide export system protein LptC